jgi:hypothetical protein
MDFKERLAIANAARKEKDRKAELIRQQEIERLLLERLQAKEEVTAALKLTDAWVEATIDHFLNLYEQEKGPISYQPKWKMGVIIPPKWNVDDVTRFYSFRWKTLRETIEDTNIQIKEPVQLCRHGSDFPITDNCGNWEPFLHRDNELSSKLYIE